jgi:soluble lytic murein transglycosylase-like protein
MIRLCAFLVCFGPVLASETAVLTTGQRLDADRIERDGDRYILHLGAGRIELAAAEVASIEAAPAVDSPAPLEESPAAAARTLTPRELVTEAARRHGLPPEFVHSVAMAESAYQTHALSPKGAIGVMQLMPGTARYLNADPHDVEQNIDAGTRLLRELLLKYQHDPDPVRRALAAYNAGEGAVRKHNGVPPYRETLNYVERVLRNYWKQAGGVPQQ